MIFLLKNHGSNAVLFQCGVQNFRRRDQCFKCGGPKTDEDGGDETSPHPTNSRFLNNTTKVCVVKSFSVAAVLLRGLDTLSTEDSVLNCLMRLTQLPIKSIRIGKDSLTNTSRGVCYVEMNTVVDAMFLHNQLIAEPPQIDDKLVSVAYYRIGGGSGGGSGSSAQNNGSSGSQAANAALAAAQWSHQKKYSEEEIESLAEYSASTYAKTPAEKAHYLQYYRDYYRNGGEGQQSQTPTTPSATSTESSSRKTDPGSNVIVNGVEYKRYGKSY